MTDENKRTEAYQRALDELIRVHKQAMAEAAAQATAEPDPVEFRKGWIRAMAMRLAASVAVAIGVQASGNRRALAQAATQTAAVLYDELEKHFAAEAEADKGKGET